jgi:hypothetical protein
VIIGSHWFYLQIQGRDVQFFESDTMSFDIGSIRTSVKGSSKLES